MEPLMAAPSWPQNRTVIFDDNGVRATGDLLPENWTNSKGRITRTTTGKDWASPAGFWPNP